MVQRTGPTPEAEGLKVDKMPIGAVGAAVDLELGMFVGAVENIAEKLVGFVVMSRGRGCRAADKDVALEGCDEGEVAIGPGADEGTEVF